MNITIISGSPRKASVTKRLGFFLETQLKENKDLNVNHIVISDLELPFIQNVWTDIKDVPDSFKEIYQKLNDSDGFIFVTPEYNGGYSSAMKNLLDYFPKSTYAKKAIGIVTASPGAMGGMRAAMQMQQMILGFWGIPSPHMLIVPSIDKKFDENNNLVDESFSSAISSFLTEYLWLFHKLRD
ncbi:MAG: NADPH-dependent FMN reductase [Cyanobacteriota bacterium]